MRGHTRWLAPLLLVAACQAGTSPDEGGTPPAGRPQLDVVQHLHSIQRDIFTDVVEDPCSGLAVAVSGQEQHVINYTTTDPTKGFLHAEDTYTASGTGLRADGTRYVFNVTDRFNVESPNFPTPLTVISAHGNVTFISQGGAPNFTEHDAFHLVVLPSGEFKVTREFESAECGG